jgi:hypothetical protein
MKSKKSHTKTGLCSITGLPIGTPDDYQVEFRDLIIMLIKALAIHEGHWAIYLGYNHQATGVNLQTQGQPDKLVPACMTIIGMLGIHRHEQPGQGTVDAAEVNPRSARPLRMVN